MRLVGRSSSNSLSFKRGFLLLTTNVYPLIYTNRIFLTIPNVIKKMRREFVKKKFYRFNFQDYYNQDYHNNEDCNHHKPKFCADIVITAAQAEKNLIPFYARLLKSNLCNYFLAKLSTCMIDRPLAYCDRFLPELNI